MAQLLSLAGRISRSAVAELIGAGALALDVHAGHVHLRLDEPHPDADPLGDVALGILQALQAVHAAASEISDAPGAGR